MNVGQNTQSCLSAHAPECVQAAIEPGTASGVRVRSVCLIEAGLEDDSTGHRRLQARELAGDAHVERIVFDDTRTGNDEQSVRREERIHLFRCLEHCPPPLRARFSGFGCGGYEAGKQWMWARWTRLKLGVELAADEPRVRLKLDDFHERPVRRQSTQRETMLDEAVSISVGNLISMPMSFAHLRNTIDGCRASADSQPARIRPEPHRSAHVGQMLLRFHE